MSLSTKAGGSVRPTVATVTGLQAALDAKAPTTRSLSVSGLATGGGDLTANRTIAVPAASQAEAEAGTDNTKAMTALRVKQAIDALGGGGGGAVNYPGVAFVFSATGDNGTAEVGDPGRPFATLQAAYNAGARVFHVIGHVGSLTAASGGNLSFIGVGCAASVVGVVEIPSSAPVLIVGNGASMISVDYIAIQAPGGADGAHGSGMGESGGAGGDGTSAAPATVRSLRAGSVLLTGGSGGNGGHGVSGDGEYTSGGSGGNGGGGGNGNTLTLHDCEIEGAASSVTGSGGSGGNGGNSGGEYTGAGSGGSGGGGGIDSAISLVRCKVGTISVSGGSGGGGGEAGSSAYGPGTNGTSGSGGSGGYYNATLSEIGSISGGGPGIVCGVVVEGVFHATLP